MKSSQVHTFTLMVDNEFGVLTRITALIRRAGWNIRSLAVAQTAVPEVSRLTVSLECRHNTLEHVLERLGRQSCVREIMVFSTQDQIARELCLVRLNAADPGALAALCTDYDAHEAGRANGDVLLSVCCDPFEVEEMLARCRAIGLRDVARTGTIALRKSDCEGSADRIE